MIGCSEMTNGDKKDRGIVARLYDPVKKVAPEIIFLGVFGNPEIWVQGVLGHWEGKDSANLDRSFKRKRGGVIKRKCARSSSKRRLRQS